MGFLRNVNMRRHTRTLRTLDYENMDPAAMRETGSNDTGRLSDLLYEIPSVPRGPEASDEEGGEQATHLAVQGERPHPKAQWDDVRGTWVVWDDDAGEWMPVPTEH